MNDDDIPTVSLTKPVGPTGLTLSSDGSTWEGTIVEGTEFTYSSSCAGVTEFSDDARVFLNPILMWVQYSNHPALYGEQFQDGVLGYNRASIQPLGKNCSGRTVTHREYRFYVGPENGRLEIDILPQSELVNDGSGSGRYRPRLFTTLLQQYEAAAAEAEAAGTLITKKDIFHRITLAGFRPSLACNESDLRYCPQYQVGTVKKIRLTVTNRDPTILIKSESASVTEGQPARFILERRWAADLLELAPPQSETVVYLGASQDGQYIIDALPTTITFGQNDVRKVIELQTMDDSAFGDDGSVTIDLLPDTSTGSVNLHGKYTTWENWVGHTPAEGRSDQATVTITNDDNKPGITIAPAAANEGDSGSSNMTFTLTLAQAVEEAVTVNYITSDGTATAGSDYVAVTNGTATIPVNSTSATFTVSVTGDETDEADETFNVTISLPEPEPDLNDGESGEHPVAIAGGTTATAVGTIRDDDPMLITVSATNTEVAEGVDVVFVLTRSQITDTPMRVAARLNRPGSQGRVVAKFEAGAATTEVTVSTEDNALVDYPADREFTLEALGDGNLRGIDDRLYTPGDPARATVTVTDNDELQVVTVHASTTFALGGAMGNFTFRRTGDTSQSLRVRFKQITAGEDGTINVENAFRTIPAGQSELTSCQSCGTELDAGTMFTYHLWSGDGGFGGTHRVWKSGVPDSASITYAPSQAQQGLALNAQYQAETSVGASVDITFTVANYGAASTAAPVTVTSSQNDSDGNPRLSCTIADAIPAAGTATCNATLSVVEADRALNLRLSATASDGTVTSRTVGIYMVVQNGMSVGFTDTTRLPVTEPAHGADNAQAVLAVTRVGRSSEQVQVAYTVEPMRTQNRPYPAEEGADYEDNSTTPGILTFAVNETEKNITIDILGDEIEEKNELFRVTLVPPEGVLLQTDKESRVVSIVDGDPPEGTSYRPAASLELVGADPTPENAGSVDFAVVLDRVWGEDALFEVSLDAHNKLTATPAVAALGQTGDFEERLVYAAIPAGQTRFEFSLVLYDDEVREEDETFQMLMSSTRHQRLIGNDDKVLVTIADNDLVEPTGIELALTSNNAPFESVGEDSIQNDVTVTASFPDIRWPTDAADAALRTADPRNVATTARARATFDDSNSTAGLADIQLFQVADSLGAFQDVESFDIVIPAGLTSGTTTLRFKPEDDAVDEESETVIVQGTEVVASDSDDLLPVTSASFTITDNDTRGITVSPSKLAEGVGISMKEGDTSTYSLVLDTQPTDTVTITVASREGDLINLRPETLTFTTSDWNAAQTISVVSLDDGTDTSWTNSQISHQVSGGDYGSVTVGDIWMLIENTTQAYIYLEGAQASESDGHIEFTVSVRPILRTSPVLVRYTTVGDTAVAGTDYTREMTTGQTYKILNIQANQGTGTIRIPITDNQVYGPAKKTFTLNLTKHDATAKLEGDATSLTATGTITDDDPAPVVKVKGPDGDVSYVSEGLKGPVTFTLTLAGRSEADVTVDYATGQAQVLSGLTPRQGITPATAGEDYTAATGTVTFSTGDTTKMVTVQLTNDDVSEDTEFFGFKISNVQNAQLRNEATEEVTDVGLLDDDPRGATIVPTSISLDEPASGETAVASSYTVKLNSKPTDTVTVTVGGANSAVTVSGTTLSNTNQLTFTMSNWDTAQTVTVTPVKDANGTGETITLTHTPSGGDYNGIAADSVTVNVADSDTRSVVLAPTALTVTEGDTTGVGYTVKLATQPTASVTVTIGGYSGTDLTVSGAALSSDELTFTTSNWGTAQTVTVKAGEDENASNESETLTHTASGGDYAGVSRDLTVTVNDDAPGTVAVSFGAAAYTVVEGSSRSITLSLDADPERRVVIPVETGNEGGASGSDYTGVPENVTFNSGETEQSFTLSATEDNLVESGEKVKLSFGTLPSDATADTPSEATVSIHDRTQGQNLPTQPSVHFERAAYSVAEGSSVAVKVILSKAPGSDVVIPISEANRAGADDGDYTGVPDTLTFGATDTEKVITFAATDDPVDDDGERVKLSFGTLPGGITATSGGAAEATVSITDNDAATAKAIVVSPTSLTVTEEDTTGTSYTVKLSTAPTAGVTVAITGHDGTDLTLSSDQLTFTTSNWDTAQTVTVRGGRRGPLRRRGDPDAQGVGRRLRLGLQGSAGDGEGRRHGGGRPDATEHRGE